MDEWGIYIALSLCIALHLKSFTILWRELSSTTTSVQHPLEWCEGSLSTTAPVRSPHTSYRWRGERVIEPIQWMGIIRRPCLTRASGENLARAPGLHPYSLREVPSAIVMGFLITLLTIFLIGWYGETSRVCSSSSLILHKCKFKKAHWRNVYLHQMCASASMPGGGVRGYSWQWEDSWEANRSTWASPNRLQISWTAWGWSLHSPRRVSCHDWAPPERHVAIWSTPKVECIVTSNKSVSPLDGWCMQPSQCCDEPSRWVGVRWPGPPNSMQATPRILWIPQPLAWRNNMSRLTSEEAERRSLSETDTSGQEMNCSFIENV